MGAAKFFLKALNTLVSAVLVLALLMAGGYSAYALWDNARVYAAADAVQEGLRSLKPAQSDDAAARSASFQELQAINPDVHAWLTLDGTNIDYPVLQGSDNTTYLNTDAYGDFALAGSIFLDSSNRPDFTDSYNLIYGHHMDQHKMFGDLDYYKDEAFFRTNRTGTLILPDRTYHLEIFAYLLVPASESAIFSPSQWKADIGGVLTFVRQNAVYSDESTLSRLEQTPGAQILAMSTCASDYTDARTVILAAME